MSKEVSSLKSHRLLFIEGIFYNSLRKLEEEADLRLIESNFGLGFTDSDFRYQLVILDNSEYSREYMVKEVAKRIIEITTLEFDEYYADIIYLSEELGLPYERI